MVSAHKSMYEAVLVQKEHAACAASLACVFDGINSVVDVHFVINDRCQKVAVHTSR